MRIAHATSNELGNLTGGKPGDQTGKEVRIQEYVDYSWNRVFRAKDPTKADKIAAAAEIIAKNDNIGYWAGTEERYSFYLLAKQLNWDFAAIKTPCNTDCSQMVATILIALGYGITPYMYTGNEQGVLEATGKFESMPFQGSNNLKRGDILLTTKKGHTAIVLDDSKAADNLNKLPKWVAEVYGAYRVDVLSKPKTGSTTIAGWPQLGVGNLVDVCDEKDDYYYVRIAAKYYGYIPKANTLRKTENSDIVKYASTSLNVRINAGAEYESLGYLKEGERLRICDKKKAKNGADWYYIKFGQTWGFCSAKYTRSTQK